jgi:toluene monooxygenase system protein B
MTSTHDGPAPQPQEAGPYLIPLNAVFDDDFLELLIPVMSNNTIAELAAAVAQHAEGIRVPARDAEKVVFFNGRQLAPGLTVAEAGIAPLDHVRVDYAS